LLGKGHLLLSNKTLVMRPFRGISVGHMLGEGRLTYILVCVGGAFQRNFYMLKETLQDPGGQDNVKLRLPFARSKILTSRQLSS